MSPCRSFFTAVALATALCAPAAMAASFYTVVPAPNKQSTAPVLDIQVDISPIAIPPFPIGQAYHYDLRPHVSVTGDPNYDASNLYFEMPPIFTLPQGITLSTEGIISGTPVQQSSYIYVTAVFVGYKSGGIMTSFMGETPPCNLVTIG